MLAQTAATLRFLATDPVASARPGATPHAVLHRVNKAVLRYFAPAAGVDPRPPVFVSMPLINTWTIFDLLPGYSVVERLIGAGHPVYLLDWGCPGPEDATRPLRDYVDALLGRMITYARRHAGVPTIDAIGYCVGGTFLAMHLARAPRASDVRRVALLATPIDFHASGRLATWAKPENFPLDAIVDGFGNFPGELMRTSFQWLRPAGQVAKWRSLRERIDAPGFPEVWATLERWNEDAVAFPGEAYRAYVRGCYFENALMKPRTWNLDGRPVDLAEAKIPALAIAASDDHIVPSAAAFGLRTTWGGPVATRTIRGGHVGICLGKELPAVLVEWLAG
jgi:polyhydroxyalkanoate synthase